MNHYTLVNGEPVIEPDYRKWGRWMNLDERVVAKVAVGESEVSTVFLGLDHAWNGGPPILWETMIFGGPLDHEQERCGGTLADARAMHIRMVERAAAALHGGAPASIVVRHNLNPPGTRRLIQ